MLQKEFYEDIDILKQLNIDPITADIEFEDMLLDELSVICNKQNIYAVYTTTGTNAIYHALKAVDVQAGDYVATSAWGFAGDLVAIEMLNAIPVFIDVDPLTFEMTADSLESAFKRIPNIKVVLTVDMFGCPCDYPAIFNVCERYNVPVIQDVADSLGEDTPLGKCGVLYQAYLSTISFNYAKPHGGYAFGGGIISVNKKQLIENIKDKFEYSNFGKIPNGVHEVMSTINCGLTALRLRRYKFAKQQRLEGMKLIKDYLQDQVQFQEITPGCTHSWYNVVFVTDNEILRSSLDGLGINKDALVNLKRYRDQRQFCPIASNLAPRSLTIFLYPSMSLDYIESQLKLAVNNKRKPIQYKMLNNLMSISSPKQVIPSDIKTPAFILHLDSFESNLKKYIAAANTLGIKLLYAAKANYHEAFIKRATQQNIGFSVNSVKEANVCLAANSKIVNSHLINITESNLPILYKCQTVTVYSPDQLKRFGQRLVDAGIDVLIRVDPFGLTRHGAPVDIWMQEDLSLVSGIHIHPINLENHVSVTNISDNINKILTKLGSCKHCNLGGRHTLKYLNRLINVINAFIYKPENIYIELGTSLVKDHVSLVTSVVDLYPWYNVAVIDASQVFQLPFDNDIICNEAVESIGKIWRLQGPTCISQDVLGDYRFTDLQIGQKLTFKNVGAYTLPNASEIYTISDANVYVN